MRASSSPAAGATATSSPSRRIATRSADRTNLAQAVADVDDAHALGPERPDDAEEPVRLLLGERGGRLVQAEQADAGAQAAHDLDQLPLRRPEAAAGGPRIDRALEPEPGQHEPGAAEEPGPVHEAQARAGGRR